MGRLIRRITRFAIVIACLCALGCNPPPGNALFVLGARPLPTPDWEPVESPLVFGVTVALEPKLASGEPMPFEIEFGTSSAVDTEEILPFEFSSSVMEMFVGARKSWTASNQRTTVYGSGGVGYLLADFEVKDVVFGGTASVDDSSMALYVGGGVFHRLGARFLLGTSVRYTFGTDLNMGGFSTDVDGIQYGLQLGWNWPLAEGEQGGE